MRRAVLLAAAAVLLAAPTVLAFFSGGYFDGPRFVATLVAWGLVVVVGVAARRPLPLSTPGRLALAGLVLIAAWSGASLAWAPLSESATDNVVRLLMYVGAFVAAMAVLQDRWAAHAAEPVLALGSVVVIGYGLAGRLLPGLIEQQQSTRAFGRLEQPLTYWNAEGALAAIGLVLCARLAGAESRPAALRAASAAACAPLGMGVYLSYSRGAIAAGLVGLVVLVALAPTWTQLRAVAGGLGAAVAGAVAGGAFPGVASLEGSPSERESDGLVVLGILAVVAVCAALAQARFGRAGRAPAARGALPVARRLPAIAALAVAICLAGLVGVGLSEQGDADELNGKRGISRLVSVDSRRYDYWRVGVDSFLDHPLTGVGSGGFRVEWVRERPVREAALEVHSLPLEMAVELGLLGLVGLGLFLGGVATAGRRGLAAGAALVPGAGAALTVWCLHAAIDWDWQMPAVTLPALVLAGGLVAAGERATEAPRGG